ncbi:TonB-dependent receptor plug domain-containing protein [Flavobacteriaceae bacterium TP-CH-4]|uniref:TonB-dependent receptor plug domain-containing protein n=1 Tax=Pelagihabitans pacificus TaxID=2696054 RepID=A0A967ATP4_9FLAO|nr:TonB-dependent receptor [Pelagihabitans pacificus]NHF58798.1 TonB-dependent receptor plug domain-containing protein [Pelagihabitans pacificus]
MRLFIALSFTLFFLQGVYGQETVEIKGTVLSSQSQEPLRLVQVTLESAGVTTTTDTMGGFQLMTEREGSYIMQISLQDYISKRIPIELEGNNIDMGALYLESDITSEQTDNLISLTDSELFDDEVSASSTALLQGTRDVFLNTAAFDFGQAFFRVRGYDSQNGRVLINGIPMNKFFDGRPQWNNWGGLNDVTRNQQFTNGLDLSDFTFGGILGTTYIDTRPSGLRPGMRISSSVSNRTYAGRVMATYTSAQEKGLAYSFSGSRRWANEGYIEGTLYDAFSFFGAVQYAFNDQNSINLTGIFASNRRGRSSAITEEVFELVGNRYNPYWGEQGGDIRNSRERKIAEPMLLLNHYYESEKFNLTTGIAYQFGTNERSRLGYYNAPNPDPSYYRYLPSFYINSPIGANFRSAQLAEEGFLIDPQLDWDKMYRANTGGKAAYVLYDDTVDNHRLSVNTIGNWNISDKLQGDFGLTYQQLKSDNYAQINDLLGAIFHEDIDPFSNTLNDLNGIVQKGEGAIFNYRYRIVASQFNSFAQLRYKRNKWNAFLAGNYSATNYQREGLFQNERFIESSLGKSEMVQFIDYGLKSGFTYLITGRHWITAQGALLTRPVVLQNVFVNPRENNQIVPDIMSENISTVDLNYFLRLPKLTGRLSAFYTRFQNTTDINFFFVDAGVGSDFVQEVLTNSDKLHKGLELGLEYQLSSSVKVSSVAAVGSYRYASDPDVSINFDTAGASEDVINPDGNIDLGVARIKNLNLGQGPQQAFSLAIEYRDPNYWWLKASANYLADNYANISTITRTQSFYLNPETGRPFPDATQEYVDKLLRQKPLDNFYLLNLVGGKSWLKKGKYLSVFASINNVFNTVFRTGGYEQSRNGNFEQLRQDNLSGVPSFAPKYWYGYGRTYFLNVAFSF